MQQHTEKKQERRQRKRSLRFNFEDREWINNVAFAPAGAIRTADGTIILEHDRVAPQWQNVTADFDNGPWINRATDNVIWITEPLSIITETDVALSLGDGSGRNFRREISAGEIEEVTVELEWRGEWHEYRRIGNNQWRRTRRVE